MKTVKFKNWDCEIVKKQYSNGRIALQLISNNELIAVATTNIVDFDMNDEFAKDHTFIKNWSENEGILDALIKAEVIVPTGMKWQTGFVYADLVKVLI